MAESSLSSDRSINKSDYVKEYLIELVRSRPVLYSKADKNFKDSRTIKKNNWNDIAKEMSEEIPDQCGNWTGDDASKLWTSLRDTFMSNKRNYEIRCASGGPGVPEPTWKFWPILKWLLDFNKKQVSVSNVQNPGPSRSTNILSPPIISPPPSVRSDEGSDASAQPQTGDGSETFVAAKKRKHNRSQTIDLNASLTAVDEELRQWRESSKEPDDDAHIYALSVATKLRKMTDYQASMARREIEMVLFNIQYNCPPYPPSHYGNLLNVSPSQAPNQLHQPLPHEPSISYTQAGITSTTSTSTQHGPRVDNMD